MFPGVVWWEGSGSGPGRGVPVVGVLCAGVPEGVLPPVCTCVRDTCPGVTCPGVYTGAHPRRVKTLPARSGGLRRIRGCASVGVAVEFRAEVLHARNR